MDEFQSNPRRMGAARLFVVRQEKPAAVSFW
jgi:hypothetical protein